MPRPPRNDYRGALQHVMLRGVERRAIFLDDEDRAWFLHRLADALEQGGTRCLAWALMPNHVHLLLETGPVPLCHVVHRLGTGYAIAFNRKYERVGHLFQDRYRSFVVEAEGGLLRVLRYVHLNPVKASHLPDLDALAVHPWTGHSSLMGRLRAPFQDTEAILRIFGPEDRAARMALRGWMEAGLGVGPDPAEESGLRGAKEAFRGSRPGSAPTGTAGWGNGDGRDIEPVLSQVCRALRAPEEDVRSGRRYREASLARAAFAYLATERLGLRPGQLV